ncbi:hypothetical protein GTX53_26110 [Streptomyces sp. SID5594]|uniref:hypothetical protein n=1 Tax=unclassified Streptomyces TaxID=2593676 RepID=UPI0003A6A9F1|nr:MULTISPECIES: hypothetical protein [unclassified Streptomyces]MZF57265.1 hypothetical protein [Streptomyces sp. SID5594]
MPETHGEVLRKWLLGAVLDLGGAAPRSEVQQRFLELYGARLTAQDREPRVGRPGGEAAWKNNLDSLYDVLKKQGLMEPSRRGGAWTLSDSGRARAEQPLKPSHGPVEEESLLQDFKPGDSSDYVARLQGRVLKKSRKHESLLDTYGRAVSVNGWRLSTLVRPRDLELVRGDQVWLAEVKMVYKGNATQASRAALAQLLEYRHFYYEASTPPGLLAVFSEPIGLALVSFLDTCGIATVWRADGSWHAGDRAREAGLLPPAL